MYYLTRNEILDAIEWIMNGFSRGLCGAFGHTGFNVAGFIQITGGKVLRDHYGATGYYWPPKFRNKDRLMFLAFMLTWHDDITENSHLHKMRRTVAQ